jgi:hypothetical protein
MHIILRAEIVVLGHQVSDLEKDLVILQLEEILDGEDYSASRRVLLGMHTSAVRMFDLASDHYQEVMNYC